jgi:hypothetical protein
MSSRLLLLVLAACGGNNFSFTATAKVEGPFVVIEANCNVPAAKIEAGGVTSPCDPDAPAMLRVPAQSVGSGPKTIVVNGTGVGQQRQVEVSVDIPASAIGPYFEVSGCPRAETSGEFLSVEAGSRTFDCSTGGGGARVKLSLQASPNGKLTIGGKPVAVPASGKLDHVLDLGEGILALSLDDLTAGGSDGPPISVPWKLDAGGKQLEGTIATRVKFGNHDQLMWQWLRDVAAGKVERPRFTPRTEGRKTAIRVPENKFSKLAPTDRRGTTREVSFLAIEREAKRSKDGTCDFVVDRRNVTATRYGVELEVKLVSTANGKPIETKVFPAPAGCPEFAMLDPKRAEVAVRVREEDVMAWLETHLGEATGTEQPVDWTN